MVQKVTKNCLKFGYNDVTFNTKFRTDSMIASLMIDSPLELHSGSLVFVTSQEALNSLINVPYYMLTK